MRRVLSAEAHVRYFSASVPYVLTTLDDGAIDGTPPLDTPDQRIQQDLQRLQAFLSNAVFGGAYQPGMLGSGIQPVCVGRRFKCCK